MFMDIKAKHVAYNRTDFLLIIYICQQF